MSLNTVVDSVIIAERGSEWFISLISNSRTGELSVVGAHVRWRTVEGCF